MNQKIEELMFLLDHFREGMGGDLLSPIRVP